jgi:hypothetical protein
MIIMLSKLSDELTVDVSTAAAILGLSESTVQRRCRSGELKAFADQGRWRVLRSSLPSPIPLIPGDPTMPATSAAGVLSGRLATMAPLLTPEQVAHITGLGISAVRSSLRSKDGIPYVKVGSRRMVPTIKLGIWLGIPAGP